MWEGSGRARTTKVKRGGAPQTEHSEISCLLFLPPLLTFVSPQLILESEKLCFADMSFSNISRCLALDMHFVKARHHIKTNKVSKSLALSQSSDRI